MLAEWNGRCFKDFEEEVTAASCFSRKESATEPTYTRASARASRPPKMKPSSIEVSYFSPPSQSALSLTCYLESTIVYRMRMSLKRKRSSSAISPSTSSTATTSSRDPSSSPSLDIFTLENASFSPPAALRPDFGSSRLHSRTRKRFRDNRPDETTIHGALPCPETCLLKTLRADFLPRNNLQQALRSRTVSSTTCALYVSANANFPDPNPASSATTLPSQFLDDPIVSAYGLGTYGYGLLFTV